MKGSFNKIFMAVLWIVVGAIFIFCQRMPTITVQVIGGLLIGMVVYSSSVRLAGFVRNKRSFSLFTTSNILQLFLGTSMLLSPDFFVKFIIYVCGGVLLFVGYMMLSMFFRASFVRANMFFLMLIAFGLIVLGFMSISHYQSVASLPFTILGFISVCKGVNDIVNIVNKRANGTVRDDGFDDYEDVTDQ